MSLFAYATALEVEADIRAVMRRAGYSDADEHACRVWARAFIVSIVPHWQPGRTMTDSEARKVGAAFEVAVNAARGREPFTPKFASRRHDTL